MPIVINIVVKYEEYLTHISQMARLNSFSLINLSILMNTLDGIIRDCGTERLNKIYDIR